MNTIEALFNQYLEDNCCADTDTERRLQAVSRTLDNTECATGDKLAEYELLARRAGFYAGFKAAMGEQLHRQAALPHCRPAAA